MTYTGDVTAGGAPDTRTLNCLEIVKFAVDEMSNNVYLLTCRSTGERLLIDAAADSARILEVIGGQMPTAIVTTHRHWDHHRALADVVAATGARSYAGQADAEAITSETGVPTEALADGDTIAVGQCSLQVIGLVGHTPGSIALLYRDPARGAENSGHLFTGDSLFPGGIGNTFGDAGAFATLIDDVETKIFGVLPDDVWFYPGHGGDSTLGRERPALAQWRERGW